MLSITTIKALLIEENVDAMKFPGPRSIVNHSNKLADCTNFKFKRLFIRP